MDVGNDFYDMCLKSAFPLPFVGGLSATTACDDVFAARTIAEYSERVENCDDAQ